MRKKEPWMFKGAIVLVLAGGGQWKKATITAMQENTITRPGKPDVDYVYYIDCKVEGEKRSGRYHPNDVQELVVPVPA